MLREVLEYADGFRAGAMNQEGLNFVCASARAQVERDHGLGPQPVREQMLAILAHGADKQKGVFVQHVADSLAQLVRRSEHEYLKRWADEVRSGRVRLEDAEILARLAAAHLLDAGFAAQHVHGWLVAKKTVALDELLELGDQMCADPEQSFEVLVPFVSLPSAVRTAAGTRFRTAEQTEAFLEERGAEKPPGRQGAGSLTFAVTAREPWSAVAVVDTEIRRLNARVAVALRNKTATPLGKAIVLDSIHSKWRDLEPRGREILVTGIERHGLLLPDASDATKELDDAFELLAAVRTSTSWASVAAIWAAIEGLLGRATDKGTLAADRMAAVVAAGLVRTELVLLATRYNEDDGSVGTMLRDDSRTFSERVDDLFDLISSRSPLPETTVEDDAAVMRLQSIVDDAAVLRRIEEYLKAAFRRLYQQRNLLLHGGRFDSVALPLTMRTVPALAAAGLDRLVFSVSERRGSPPLALAARAQNEIALLGGDGARSLPHLLD
ncbi:hypothetical protein [uncultured Nocardioides sp.]|uniref:hypothetical protein n=1 Tax=uncultured Nocardioides sp. TaxID=198441 RepID=UPI00263562C1|nr:hypothetical protein [uncultured Nocardioides sp.]